MGLGEVGEEAGGRRRPCSCITWLFGNHRWCHSGDPPENLLHTVEINNIQEINMNILKKDKIVERV